jgi:hypothetical protein
MKKGYSIIIIFSILLLSLRIVSAAYSCMDGSSDTPCVCGHTPNSAQGYGQVIIGGGNVSIISCDNIDDDACPEDFMDPVTRQVGNCSSCPDPDCTATVNGGVLEDRTGAPVEKAVITGNPIKWNQSANLERSNLSTNAQGNFTLTALTGTYFFSASKGAYDTQLIEATVIRGKTASIYFRLINGTCHSDCTNSYGRCNQACDGVNFTDGMCRFYSTGASPLRNDAGAVIFDGSIASQCNNRMLNTEIRLGQKNATAAYFIKCNTNTAPYSNAPYIKYYATASTDTGTIKNLIKVEKIAKYNDIPVRVVIAYWQS